MLEFHNEQPNSSEGFRTVPNGSESFGNVPQRSEGFRNAPQASEPFRTLPQVSERDENHTLTVKEVARLFEAAGVARTERSIVNWCQPNRTGVARLNSYFDPNERRYYVSPQSVELAIAEEKAKAAKNNDAETFGKVPPVSEPFRTVPQPSEEPNAPTAIDQGRVKELERENLDLKIANRAKDMVIERMGQERESFLQEALSANRKVGELEHRLLSLEGSTSKPSSQKVSP